MKDVKLVKLTNGDEIVCEIIGKKTSEYGYECITIKFPFAVAPNPQHGGIGVFPWCISTIKASDHDEYDISLASVVMISTPPQEMVNAYIEQTSGIAMPQSKGGLILG